MPIMEFAFKNKHFVMTPVLMYIHTMNFETSICKKLIENTHILRNLLNFLEFEECIFCNWLTNI